MKRFATVALTVLLFLLPALATAPAIEDAPAFSVSESTKENQHKAFHWIVLQNDASESFGKFMGVPHEAVAESAAGCTAYAIAPHVLLTAQHCDLPDAKVFIDSTGDPHDGQMQSKAADIAEKVYDGHDHMLLLVPSVTFKDTVKYEPKKYRPAVQGEQVYMWGNPQWFHDMYREGYMMGITTAPEAELVPIDTVMYVFDLNGNHGDSGSAIFSARDGRIVSIVTYGLQDGKFIGGFLLSFTKEQVKEIKGGK